MENVMILQLKQNLLASNISLRGHLFNLIIKEKIAVPKLFEELRQKIHTMEENFYNNMNDYERNQLQLKEMSTRISNDNHSEVLKQCQDFSGIFEHMIKHIDSVRENIQKISKIVDSCNEYLIKGNNQGKVWSNCQEPLASKSNPFVPMNFNFDIYGKEEEKATSQTEDNAPIEIYQPSYKLQKRYALEVRRLYEQGHYEEILFNPRYSYFFCSLTPEDYKSLVLVLKRPMPNFSLWLDKKWQAWMQLVKRMRYKYHSKLCLDYLDEPGGFHQQEFFNFSYKTKQFLKVTCLTEIPDFKPMILSNFFSIFSGYYFKLSGSKLKLYGYMDRDYRKIFRYYDKIFKLPHILKFKVKFFQFGEDWIIPFYMKSGFSYNLDENYCEKLWESHEKLDLLRRDFTKEMVKRLNKKYL